MDPWAWKQCPGNGTSRGEKAKNNLELRNWFAVVKIRRKCRNRKQYVIRKAV